MSGYVLDHLALIAGLSGAGTEHQRRAISRLLDGAAVGGPTLDLPALCLTATSSSRPGIAEHVADLIASVRTGAIAVSGLTRTTQLDGLVALRLGLGWPATHAAARALATGQPVFTPSPAPYLAVGLNVVAL